MRYYIATSLERHTDHNLVRDAMAAEGHEITYDWSVHGPVWAAGVGRIREVAQLETQGVLDADVVIVLLPGGRGTHAELGMAIAAGKPILLHCADTAMFEAVPETCAFYHHPLVMAASGPLERLPGLAAEMWPRRCRACRHCFMEPDDDLCCGHKDAGPMGTYIRRAAAEGGHCGPDRPKFEQHPFRLPSGLLRGAK